MAGHRGRRVGEEPCPVLEVEPAQLVADDIRYLDQELGAQSEPNWNVDRVSMEI